MNLKPGPLEEGRRERKRRTKEPRDATSWAVNSYIRLAVLTLLHEKALSPHDIADALGLDLKRVSEHMRLLYDAGCIEFVGQEGQPAKNFSRNVYRPVARPVVSEEEYRAMSIEERDDLNGVALQWIIAECLASHRSGKMSEADTVCLISDEPNLDAKGVEELNDLLPSIWEGPPDAEDHLSSIQDIAVRAAHRMAESGETGSTIVVTVMAFERARPKKPESELKRLSLGSNRSGA
jgi:DNA-binding transcriptional ArsR family regulator